MIDIERLAREAGTTRDGRLYLAYLEDLHRFAALVRNEVLEEAAKVCDEKAKRNFPKSSENTDMYMAQAHWAEVCARTIRALKNKT
jgi:chromatin segregation and condensation protein Rec8/ScpA/Scc1 (kleisin family)